MMVRRFLVSWRFTVGFCFVLNTILASLLYFVFVVAAAVVTAIVVGRGGDWCLFAVDASVLYLTVHF